MQFKTLSIMTTIIVVVVVLFVLSSTTSTTTSLINAQSTSTTSPSSSGTQVFTVRSLPFNNGNIAMTFQDQVQELTRQMARVIDNTSIIQLAYNSSSQSQQCWADVQECAQTFTWWFTGSGATANQDLFVAKGNNDDTNAKLLGVEVFRRGTTVPVRVDEVPSIWPFLTTLISVYAACSIGSGIIMIVGYVIANK